MLLLEENDALKTQMDGKNNIEELIPKKCPGCLTDINSFKYYYESYHEWNHDWYCNHDPDGQTKWECSIMFFKVTTNFQIQEQIIDDLINEYFEINYGDYFRGISFGKQIFSIEHLKANCEVEFTDIEIIEAGGMCNAECLKNLEDEDPDWSDCVESDKKTSLIYWECSKCREQQIVYEI